MNGISRTRMAIAMTLLIMSVAAWGQGISTSANEEIAGVWGSGDGRIHIIPTLSAKSIKNGDRASIQAVIKALDGVAKVEARIDRNVGPISQSDPFSEPDTSASSWPGIVPGLLSDHLVENLLGLPVVRLELKGVPMNLGGVNAAGTMGMWQAEWEASGLEEGYYRVALTVTDRTGHSYTDRSLVFADPIAGNDVAGNADYPVGGMRRLDAVVDLIPGDVCSSAVIDTANGYAYFGTNTSPAAVVKVSLGAGAAPPSRVGAVTLNTGEKDLRGAVIDAASGYAYFGTMTTPGIVVKVALGAGAAPPSRVGALTLNAGEDLLRSAVIDATSGYAYFGTWTSPGLVVKVALGDGAAPPSRVGAVTLNTGETDLISAVIDAANGYAYFGTQTYYGIVVKVALGEGAAPPSRVGAVTLNAGESCLYSAVIDAANGYAYFGTQTVPGIVVKVALGAGTTPPTRVGAVTLNAGEDWLFRAVIDTASGYAYFGTQQKDPGVVVKVALGAGAAPPTRVGAVTLNAGEYFLYSAVLDTANGYAYFGTGTYPGRVVKVALGAADAPPSRVGAVTLNAGESWLCSAVIDAANGYAYFGTYSSPVTVVKVALGSGAVRPTRVGAVTLNSGENLLYSAVIDTANGYAYFGTRTYPGRVVKVALGAGAAPPTRVGAVTLNAGENCLNSAVIDTVGGYAYFGTWDTTPAIVVKVALGAGAAPPSRVGAVTLNAGETNLLSAVIDAANGYAYFGTQPDPGIVVKVALGVGAAPPSRVGAVTLNTGERELSEAVIDVANGYAYFVTATNPGIVVKVALGDGAAPPSRVGAVTLNSGENQPRSAVIDAAGGYAYFGTGMNPGAIVKVALGEGAALPSRVGAVTLNTGESNLSSAVIDAAGGYAYFGTWTNPGVVVRVGLSQKGFLKGTNFAMPQAGSVDSVSFFSHAALGNVRLALYDNSANPALLWESASTVNTAANAWLTVPISSGTPSSLSLTTGTYWLAWQVDTAIPVPSYATGVPGDGFFVPMAYGSCPPSLQAGTGTAPTLTDERWSEYITYLGPPAAPSNPGSAGIGLDTITWNWQDNSGDETGFKVYDDPGAGPPSTLQTTTDPDVEQRQHNSLSANTQYAFQVSATNDYGDSATTSNYAAYTLTEAVSGLEFSAVGTSSISVAATNTPSNLASGSSGLYFANTTQATNSGWQQNNTPWASTGLSPNTLYAFSGKSRNGDSTETTEATGSKYTLAATPIAPTVASPGVHSLDVTIGGGDGNPAATTYAIQISPAVGGNTWVQADGTVGASAVYQTAVAWGTRTVTGLTEYAPYSFTVTAMNGEAITTSPGSSGNGMTLDGTAPVVTVTSLSTNDNTPRLTGTVVEAVGVAGMQVVVNGHTYAATVTHASGDNYDWYADVTDLLPDGTYDVVATATDLAGNPGADVTTDDLTIDPGLPTTVNSILRVGASPTNAVSVQFTVTFSQSVSGVDITDVVIHAGSIPSASVTGVGGTGDTHTVTVSTGTGDGTVGVDVVDDDSIRDTTYSRPLGGTGVGNGNFTAGELYAIDKTSPSVALSTPRNPTNAAPIVVTATFSEPVLGYTGAGITAGHATMANFTVVSPTEYRFELTPSPNDYQGAITADLAAGATQDAATNPNTAAPQLSMTYDTVPPTVDISVPSAFTTENGPVTYTVTYDGADTVSLTTDDVELIATGTAQGEVFISEAKAMFARVITIDNIEGQGTLAIRLDAGTSCDAADNCDLGFAETVEAFSVEPAMPVAGVVSLAFLAAVCMLTGLGAINRRR